MNFAINGYTSYNSIPKTKKNNKKNSLKQNISFKSNPTDFYSFGNTKSYKDSLVDSMSKKRELTFKGCDGESPGHCGCGESPSGGSVHNFFINLLDNLRSGESPGGDWDFGESPR